MDKNIIIFLLLIYSYLILLVQGSTRIVGGSKAPLEFGRFHVSLQNMTGHHVCGGVIVSLSYLVTAAHCVNGAEPQYIKAVVGTTNLDDGGTKYEIQRIYMHDGYNITLRLHDIAVLRIKGAFDLKLVDVLKLDENELKEGDQVLLTGFGANKPNEESSRQMHALNLTVFDQSICQYAMRYTRKVHTTMFCTFTKIGQGTCHGDSGGPLTKEKKLVGIVSWGIPCAVGFPDVHTRISSYVEWIRKIIDRPLCECICPCNKK